MALGFLKKRFRDYSVKTIAQALFNYVIEKENAPMYVPILPYGRTSNISYSKATRFPEPPFMHNRTKPIFPEDRAGKT